MPSKVVPGASVAVLEVVEDVMKELNDVMPGIKAINFRQDNAKCYHSAATILQPRSQIVVIPC